MSWSTALGQMALCLVSPLVALFATSSLGILPENAHGGPYQIAAAAFLALCFFYAWSANRRLKRGTALFAYTAAYSALIVASVGLTFLIQIFLPFGLDLAGFVVCSLLVVAVAGLLLFSFVCGGEDNDTRSVEVQRGRQRFDTASSFLYVAAPEPTTDPVYDSDFDDPAFLGPDFVAPESDDPEDDDPAVYEVFRAYSGEIPESEFDENYTYDVRRPDRLPLKKDSVFRKYFELQARQTNE